MIGVWCLFASGGQLLLVVINNIVLINYILVQPRMNRQNEREYGGERIEMR